MINYEDTLTIEKRKTNGIYYTPPQIVEYIIQNTLTPYLNEHTYNENSKIKIIDINCGTGNFLTKAYKTLIKYHETYLKRRLTITEKQEILTKNIYGTDNDKGAIKECKKKLNLINKILY